MDASHAQAFTMPLRVAAADIDLQGHVNNTVYLRWVQEVAVAHWQAIAPPEAHEAVMWVVRRHEIDYHQPALAGDELLVRTWVGEASKLTFQRHTEVVRTVDDRLLARALTLWVPVDVATGRPTRVSAEVRGLFSA